jgi:hypothetical protein
MMEEHTIHQTDSECDFNLNFEANTNTSDDSEEFEI